VYVDDIVITGSNLQSIE
jgi:hypothetical protein